MDTRRLYRVCDLGTVQGYLGSQDVARSGFRVAYRVEAYTEYVFLTSKYHRTQSLNGP